MLRLQVRAQDASRRAFGVKTIAKSFMRACCFDACREEQPKEKRVQDVYLCF